MRTPARALWLLLTLTLPPCGAALAQAPGPPTDLGSAVVWGVGAVGLVGAFLLSWSRVRPALASVLVGVEDDEIRDVLYPLGPWHDRRRSEGDPATMRQVVARLEAQERQVVALTSELARSREAAAEGHAQVVARLDALLTRVGGGQ